MRYSRQPYEMACLYRGVRAIHHRTGLTNYFSHFRLCGSALIVVSLLFSGEEGAPV
jgi:hypothetical protein